MPQIITEKCPHCSNLQQSRYAPVTDCRFCDGLGATVKLQFALTDKGRKAKQALIDMRRMRVQIRHKGDLTAKIAGLPKTVDP